MTLPRMVFDGTTYLITRTTTGRRFLLRPGGVVNEVFLYCLFRAAKKYGVQVHCVSVESNHFHAVVTDMRGEISRFVQWLDSMVANNLMRHYGRTHPSECLDGIWSKDHFSAVVLATPEQIIKSIVYGLTNPVKDGLVRDYRQWPGLNSRPGDWLKPTQHARRPRGLFFSDKSKKHRWAEVKYTVPPMFADRDTEHFVDSVNAMIRDTTKSLRRRLAIENRAFLGVKESLAVNPFDSPQTPRPKGLRSPCFAAGGDTTVLTACLALLRSFRQRYRAAWAQLRQGMKGVVFPAGTYLLRVHHNVAHETLHPPWCCAAT